MTTTGFHWKSIEEKPEHWEEIRLLIEDGLEMQEENNSYISEKEDEEKIEMVYEVFLKKYEEIPKMMRMTDRMEQEGGKKNSKTKKIGKTKEIQSKVWKEIIQKDFLKFQLKDYIPIRCVFHKTYMMYFLIIWWNMEMTFVSKKKREEKKYRIANLNSLFSLRKAKEDPMIANYEKLKGLLEGMEEYRKEKDKEVYKDYDLLFDYPEILYHNFYEDRKSRRVLYKEQRDILNRMSEAIETKKPILMGNQMPTGSGKTFLVIPLTRRISVKYHHTKTVLFCCSNELVNKEISQLALIADDVHLWLAKYVIEPKTKKYMTLLRPHKRCYPACWKQIYKNTNTEKVGSVREQMQFYMKQTQRRPNIIVADLVSTYKILSEIQDDSMIAYIDEFISDEKSDREMSQICKVLPKYTVILSSILPSFEELKPIIDHYCRRFSCSPQDCLHRVETLYIPISCAVIDPEGRLSMPHHYVNSREECQVLYEKLKTHPRLRRMYSIRHIYYWSKSLPEKVLETTNLRFDEQFKDVCMISIQKMTEYAVELVRLLVDHWDCWKKEFQTYRPRIMPVWKKESMLSNLSIYLQEKTLYVTNHVQEDVQLMTRELFEGDCPIRWSQIEQEKKKAEEYYDRQKKSLELKTMRKNDKWIEMDQLQEESSRMVHTIPRKYIMNTKEHFTRFHSSLHPSMSSFRYTLPFYSPSFYESFDDQFNIWFSAGLGMYDPSCMTAFQLNRVMDFYSQYSFLISNNSIVFGTNLPNLCTIIMDADFVESHPISHLYQLMGRVGRMGKSYHANIILPNESAMIKIMSLTEQQENIKLLEFFEKDNQEL
jgi:hypothetical protein